MDNEQLNSFLASGTPQEAAPEPAASLPEPTPEPSGTPPEPAEKASDAEHEEDDGEALSARDGEALVPRRAYETERRRRQDWKSKYTAEQAKAELLAKQLEEAKRPPPAPQAEPQPMSFAPPPDPRVDPWGYIQHQEIQRRQEMLNERLNNSEERLRDKIGDEELDKYVAEFKQMAQVDQTLYGKLYQQRHPYGWMQKEVERQRTLRDIGDNPSAFRTRIEAEVRARLEAEMAQQHANGNGQAASPVAGMAPSLANARSVAGRTTSAFTGPPPLEALFPGHNNRREQRR